VSRRDLLRCRVAVQLAEKAGAVFRRPVSQVRNEGFNLLASGIPQVRSAARIGGIGFDEIGIEPVVADQKTEAKLLMSPIPPLGFSRYPPVLGRPPNCVEHS
jgi:hypothetical protein